MKNIILFIITFLFLGNITMYSQSQKTKNLQLKKAENIAPPSSALKDIRSIPSAPKTVLNHSLRNFEPQFNFVKPSDNQRFMKIKKDQSTGLPIWISGKTEDASSQRTASTEVRCMHYLEAVKSPLKIKNPTEEFFVKKITTDQQGQKHIRMEQQFQGVPIYGSEIILHEKDNDIYLLNGRHFPTPTALEIFPTIDLQNAKSIAKTDVESFTNYKILSQEEKKYVAGDQFQSQLVIFHPAQNIKNPRLAYHFTVIPNLTERWEYLIDAKTGEVLQKYSNICKFHAHLENHSSHENHVSKSILKTKKPNPNKISNSENFLNGPATANEQDLLGITRTINTYEVDGTYFLYDGSRPMFDINSDLPSDPKGMIVTVDGLGTFPNNSNFDYQVVTSSNNSWGFPAAVSAHYNGGEAYEYFKNTHGRESINGQGGTIISFFNVSDENGNNMDNAFWNGAAMFYGNGNQAFDHPLQRALDVAGHEMSHGVIQGTANLEYQGQSGALNESFADIFGAMIDRDDWQMGEDITNSGVFPTGFLRSLSDPNNGGSSLQTPGWQPKTMSEYQNLPNTPQGDFGGVHINSGIPNYAFFLFASDVGKETAEKVYYHALDVFLVKSSQFVDLRNAIVASAGQLYGSAEVNAANAAFDAVGIGQGSGGNYQTEVIENEGDERILHSDVNLGSLYIVDLMGDNVVTPQLSTTNIASKPSISDNGRLIVFVDDQNNIKFIDIDWVTGSIVEDFLEYTPSGNWRNVAVSKDGSRVAAVRNVAENKIYVYDFNISNDWQVFDLYNPTTSDPNTGSTVSTGEVQFADVMEFDFTGEYLMYDAFNKLESSLGNNTVEYWDIGFLNIFDNAANNFTDGNIQKLFTGLPSGVSIGNPTFSKNSPHIVAIDFKEEGFFSDMYQVIGVNIQTGDNLKIRDGDIWGFPNYSVNDEQMIFDLPFQGSNILGKINLNADKISGDASSEGALFPNGTIFEKWGVWFATGDRDFTSSTEQIDLKDLNGKVYPNPFLETLTLELESTQNEQSQIRVFNLLGKEVFQKNVDIFHGKNTIDLPLQNLSSGTYFIKIQVEKGTITTVVLKH